jgi:hypothetical protein
LEKMPRPSPGMELWAMITSTGSTRLDSFCTSAQEGKEAGQSLSHEARPFLVLDLPVLKVLPASSRPNCGRSLPRDGENGQRLSNRGLPFAIQDPPWPRKQVVHCGFFFPCFSFLGSPRMEHKALRMLGKHPTTEQHSQILSLLFLREGF